MGLGCIYYCMCVIGMVEKVLEFVFKCGYEWVVFGKFIIWLGGNLECVVDVCMVIE